MELAHTVDYVMLPYLGGFDLLGRYNVPLSRGRGMARFDPSFTPIDTIPVPEDPVERDRFFTMDETTERGLVEDECARALPGIHGLALLSGGHRVDAPHRSV